jgi:putative oxidoreductase
MKNLLFQTNDDMAGLILRVVVGGIMFPHGAQKLMGWFGGYGFNATMQFFQINMKLPWVISFSIILIEFFGSLGLIFGIATRLWAIGLFIIMACAIYTTCFANGLFMNWYGNQAGEGYEYHVLVMGMCATLFIIGGGKLSLDFLFLTK